MREVTSVEEGPDVEQVTEVRQCAESQLGASCWKTAKRREGQHVEVQRVEE